jgi:membrane protein DedA with SNARE-associated domain
MTTHTLLAVLAFVPHLTAASVTASLATFTTNTVSSLGLVGIFVLMLLDCACIPIPSEVTMLFAGFGVSRGDYSLVAVVVAGTLGNLVGSWISYAVGYYGSERLLGPDSRFIRHRSALERAERWFDRYGAISVFLGRMLPLVRTFISLPAGVARMPFGRFSIFTLLGCLPWCLALAIVGDGVGHNWTKWRDSFHYVDYAVIALAVLAVAALVVRWGRRRSRLASEA